MNDYAQALEAIVKDSGLLVNKTTRSWIFNCPKCSKPKLYFLKSRPKFVCWKCADIFGFRGKAEFGLAELLGQDIDAVRRKLYGTDIQLEASLDLSWDADEELDEEGEVVAEFTPFFWPHNFHPIEHHWSKRGQDYLAGRGVPLDIAVQYGIRYSPGKQAVAFPFQVGEYLLGWQERLIIPTEYYTDQGLVVLPKNHNPPGMPKDSLLGFVDRIQGDWAVLTEGPVTSLHCHPCGGNIWLGGKNWSDQQIQLLKNAGVRKLYIALDPDAYQASNNLIDAYWRDFELYDMVPRFKGDWGDVGFDQAYQAFKTAPRVTNYFRYHYFS